MLKFLLLTKLFVPAAEHVQRLANSMPLLLSRERYLFFLKYATIAEHALLPASRARYLRKKELLALSK
jgi:hypothetical protein